MFKASATMVVNAPIQKVFEYTASPENGPMFIPNLNQNSDISITPTQVGQKWNWRYNMVGMDITGSAEVTEIQAPHSWKLKSTGGANSTWAFTFADEGAGTKVTLEIEYDMPEGVMGKLSSNAIEKINQKTVEDSLQHLKTILEG